MVKSQNLLVALSLMLMLGACGKSMSMRVNGVASGSQNLVGGTIDTTKQKNSEVSIGTNTCKPADAVISTATGTNTPKKLLANETLESYSAFDMSEMKEKAPADAIFKRSTLQIAPKDAVSQVVSMMLVLKQPKLGDSKKVKICVAEKNCHTIDFSTPDSKALDPNAVEYDLRDLFELGQQKTTADLMDWIYSNSTEFARPGYRKFRFTFEGMTFESGSLIIQLITNEKLPTDFAAQPTCFEHGETDTVEPAPVAASESEVTTETDAED